MDNIYERKYKQDGYYWGKKPSKTVYNVLKLIPPTELKELLVIGCGEGRNAVFFARNGYKVTAFDLSKEGVEKTKRMASEIGVSLDVFQADVNNFRLEKSYDILFSTGVLHYIPQQLREEIFENYKMKTNDNGIHVFSVFVKKPFIEKAPERENNAHRWITGEIFSYYYDWKVEYCTEEIFDCMSSGIPHRHATNRIVARKIE